MSTTPTCRCTQTAARSGLSGIIAACAVVALLMFGNSGRYNSASNVPNTEPGVTTGAVR